jgi:RNA polymerase-associated protein
MRLHHVGIDSIRLIDEPRFTMATQTPEKLEFYHYWNCPYCQRARVTLAEKGIDYKGIAIDEGAEMPQELLDINPEGTVPTLKHGELALYGSEIIAEYLEERFPEPPLMPASPAERARARLALYICDNGLGSALWNFDQATGGEEDDEQKASKAADEIVERLERLSERPSVRQEILEHPGR